VIVLINKVDRSDAHPEVVLDSIYDLFIDLDATEEQIEFPVLYAIGKEGKCGEEPDKLDDDLNKLFELIIKIMPPPRYESEELFQMHVLDLDYSDYLGRLVIGPIVNGRVKKKDQLVLLRGDDKPRPLKVTNIQFYEGVSVKDTEEAFAGDIIILSGIDDVKLGDTICNANFLKKLPSINVDKPTMSMVFTINTGPFSGQEGKLVQGNKIKERLQKEIMTNVSIELEIMEESDYFLVKGRGEFQLAILIE
jgi:GTP-binding protein